SHDPREGCALLRSFSACCVGWRGSRNVLRSAFYTRSRYAVPLMSSGADTGHALPLRPRYMATWLAVSTSLSPIRARITAWKSASVTSCVLHPVVAHRASTAPHSASSATPPSPTTTYCPATRPRFPSVNPRLVRKASTALDRSSTTTATFANDETACTKR